MSYIEIHRVTYHGLPDKVTMSIPSGIGAVGSLFAELVVMLHRPGRVIVEERCVVAVAAN